MSSPPRRIGILAGGGSLPLEFARSAAARGELAGIVALEGTADADFGDLPVETVGMGQVGRMLEIFRAAGARDIVIIGPAKRPELARLRLDSGFWWHLPAILRILRSGGDDGVLTGVVRFFERQGFRVLGPAEVAPETLAPEGVLTRVKPGPREEADIQLGFEIVRRLGDLDVGQAVIVAGGAVVAIEGADGTNAMLARLARTPLAAATEPGAVLVKRPKPGQELRVDMPSIGPGSIAPAKAAGLAGIAVHAGDVLIAERHEVIARADAAGLFVAGVPDGGQRAPLGVATPGRLKVRGLRRLRAAERADLDKALEVSRRLARFACGGIVVTVGGHVLAVSAGADGTAEVLERVWTWRTRGGTRKGRGAGAIYIAGGDGVGEETVRAACRAGLRAIAVGTTADPSGPVMTAVTRICDQNGIAAVQVPPIDTEEGRQ